MRPAAGGAVRPAAGGFGGAVRPAAGPQLVVSEAPCARRLDLRVALEAPCARRLVGLEAPCARRLDLGVVLRDSSYAR